MKNSLYIVLFFLVLIGCKGKEEVPVPLPAPTFEASSFKDNRDGRSYETVIMGNQEWMVENLKYRPRLGSRAGCWTYGEKAVDTTKVVLDKSEFQKEVLKAFPDVTKFSNKYFWVWYAVGDAFVDKRGAYYNKSWESYRKESYDEYYDIPAYEEFTQGLDRIANSLHQEALIRTLDANYNKQIAEKYGFLYEFKALDQLAPEGWRIPTDEDFKKLETLIGVKDNEIEALEKWRGASDVFGEILANKNGFAGTIIYGFNNQRDPYRNKDFKSYYWTSTSFTNGNNETFGIVREFQVKKSEIYRGTLAGVEVANSVICVRDLQ